MTQTDRATIVSAWVRCGLPAAISDWLETLSGNPRSMVYLARAARFVEFADATHEQHESLLKAWAAVARSARPDASGDCAELSVFMGLPDQIEYNPFRAYYAGRKIDAEVIKRERKHYKDLGDHVAAVLNALERDGPGTALAGAAPKWTGLLYLLQDAKATQEADPDSDAGRLAAMLRNVHLTPMIDGLRGLQNLLSVLDPADKVLTDQWASDTAPQTVFAVLVANLNRYLAKPQHAALARLAQISCPEATVTSDQLRKQWAKTDKSR